MSDETTNTAGSKSQPAPGADNGILGRAVADLASFKGTGKSSPPPLPGTATSGGKSGPEKRGPGRPPKAPAPSPSLDRPEIVDDAEKEKLRVEYEGIITQLLVAYTLEKEETRFQKFILKYPEEAARGLAHTCHLGEIEKKYFGPTILRFLRRYLGDKYLFTQDGIAGIIFARYLLKNIEAMSAERKIDAEMKAPIKPPIVSNEKSNDQRAKLPSATPLVAGSNGNGKDDIGLSSRLQPPGPAGAHL
jgi:hypothetical protein